MSTVAQQSASRRYCSDPTNPKHAQAERLTSWTDGALRVAFDPDIFQAGRPDAKGNCFRIRLVDRTPDGTPGLGTVVDLPGKSIKTAIVAELRRIARHHHHLADRLEGKLPIVQENLTTWSDRVSRLCLFAVEVRLPSGMRQIVHVGAEAEINGFISEWHALHPTEAGSIRKVPISWRLADENPQSDVLDLTPDPGAEDLAGKEVA